MITASGGPFWKLEKEKFNSITLEDALQHPSWSMEKITVDSSTFVNKGLEVTKYHLFNIDFDDIDVVVHRQSIIHGLVEFIDDILAHLVLLT